MRQILPKQLIVIDSARSEISKTLDPRRRSEFGQFLTPMPIATLMASMFLLKRRSVRILDAGAGIGSLSAALVLELASRKQPPRDIEVVAFEVEPGFGDHLRDTLRVCRSVCQRRGIVFRFEIIEDDYLVLGTERLNSNIFDGGDSATFDAAILNPPYRKINIGSKHRQILRQIGIETTNLYTGFLAVTIRYLKPGGELVAITPRSFCNGTYFRSFRQQFLKDMEIRQLHIFESRKDAFRDDDVLQENVIIHSRRSVKQINKSVVVSTSLGRNQFKKRSVPFNEVSFPNDPEYFIHIPHDEVGDHAARSMAALPSTLRDLGLTVSTGRVVDFRAREFLRAKPGRKTAPLIWPAHFEDGFVRWPNGQTRKPNAIAIDPALNGQLIPKGHYALVRRFSAKEESRRVVAAVYDANQIDAKLVGFENHLNYFHRDGEGLEQVLVRGLVAYLNSSIVDVFVRRFNGHTQVNATDLRNLRYPNFEQLNRLGKQIRGKFPEQSKLDELVNAAIAK